MKFLLLLCFLTVPAFALDVETFDQSINQARAYLDSNNQLIIENKISTNPAGGFNGGGTGNKVVAGMLAPFENLGLGSLPDIELIFEAVSSASLTDNNNLYFNAIVDLGNGTQTVLFFGALNGNPALNMVRQTNISGLIYKNEFSISIDNVTSLVTIPGVTQTVAGSGQAARYTVADILAIYPNAKLVRSMTLDGGLAKFRNNAPLMLINGTSSTNIVKKNTISDFKLGGVSVTWKAVPYL